VKNDNIKWCYHFPLDIFCVIIYVIIFRVLSFMLSFDVIIFHGQQMLSFYVIIFPCTYFVLSFKLSFDVIIYCYHFPPFFFFLKTWHTRFLRSYSYIGFKTYAAYSLRTVFHRFFRAHIFPRLLGVWSTHK
jgi:hypothetical protein